MQDTGQPCSLKHFPSEVRRIHKLQLNTLVATPALQRDQHSEASAVQHVEVKLGALFEFLQGIFKSSSTTDHVGRYIPQDYFPIGDGVFVVARSCVGASQAQIGPKPFFWMLLSIEERDFN